MTTRRRTSLQAQTLLSGRGHRYCVQTEGLPLSLKCMANGRARYVVGRNELMVDDGGWLIVNEDQPYSIEIASPTPVETFIIWFPRGWAEEVLSSATKPAEALLAAPNDVGIRPSFYERYTPNENAVAPAAHALRRAFKAGAVMEDAWLEENLRSLLARMLDSQREVRQAISRLPALRAATREELWRRLDRARDFIHARCDTPLTLTEIARVAALSPYHFLRAFRSAYGQTPHDWLAAYRVDRAKFLLSRTTLPVTEVCFAVGYESMGSFSTWFRRFTGSSPRAWRQARGAAASIRNFREVFSEPHPLPSKHSR